MLRSSNVWIEKVEDYPGLLFPWFSPETEARELREMIGNSEREINLELGSGSGNHLISKALEHPEQLWIGFELRYKRSVRTLEKASKAGVENLRVVRSDAFNISYLIPDARVSSAYIRFPDPWAKARWKKHRLLNTKMLELLSTKLIRGGLLHVKTDHLEMFCDFLKDVEAQSWFGIKDLNKSVEEDAPQSEFEALFVTKGDKISSLTLELL